ncbi:MULTISPECIES: isochorismatase family protein [Pseudonocardia]|uniref:Maleamate amidohydrolase n=2 Tax=Pseudonocardia TaxID=1847 RepID=A0A1Y2MUR2_PSEAH|nr:MULTISPECIES: isochorismatase family protein [Pseudonocardia]OSY38924.1 Maleamate amidohydrolase [Pseudonocardia autotrophica]TDN76180.1 nicotinamidase-related amidase [Pseudonocardia autotrophica]BBG00161.1 N-carbamoylsarcosine amidase [Pseudonocardia autotrophica]GEC26770.1 N-carbamoylsarcosine amidase [Pseudonocardia saturnea]
MSTHDTGLHGQETDATYERAGFGGRVRRGERPAIVVVDLSAGFTDPAYPTGADLTDVVAATSTLVEAARPAGVPVVWTTVAYNPAELDTLPWPAKAPGLRGLAEGSAAVALDTRLPVDPSDNLITKKGASAFFDTGLASFLTAARVDTVLVCGATTSGCVRATVVDAVQSGFTVLVPRDCAGDRAAGPHEANLFDIQAKYGDVIDLDDALGYLKGIA